MGEVLRTRQIYSDGRTVDGLYVRVDLPGVPAENFSLFHNFKNIYFEGRMAKIWDFQTVQVYSGYLIVDQDPGEKFEYTVLDGCVHFFLPYCTQGEIHFIPESGSVAASSMGQIEEVKELSKCMLEKLSELEASNKSIKDHLQPFKQDAKPSPMCRFPMTYDQYKIEDEMAGEGAFGTVYKGWDNRDNEGVAMKSINLAGNKIQEALAREISIMYGLKHENIIKLKDVYTNPPGTLNLVMEYMDFNLMEVIKRFKARETRSSPNVKSIMHQILLAVDYLHEKNIVHRDLKSENIMVDKHCITVKVAYFGMSRLLGHNLTPQGTWNAHRTELARDTFNLQISDRYSSLSSGCFHHSETG